MDPIVTMWPVFLFFISPRKARTNTKGPTRLVLMMSMKRSGFVSSTTATLKIPALFTRMSGLPRSSVTIREAAFSTLFGSLTSHTTGIKGAIPVVCDALRILDITHDGDRALDPRRQLPEFGFRPRHQHYKRAFLAQGLGNARSDSARCSGYDSGPAAEGTHSLIVAVVGETQELIARLGIFAECSAQG